jgi:glycosyltransferase involved in cell wall biosynthesis
MHEIPTAHLHFDPPLPGLIGGTLLQGWLVPKPGRLYTDVRVVAGGKIFPGIHGIPRRDLAEFFKSDQPSLLAGFSVTLTLPAGRHRLVLEGCTIAGTWEPLDSLEREVTAAEARPDPAARTPLDATAIGEALRVLLRRLADNRLTPQAGAAAIIDETPARHHLQHPPRPFYGHLDQPAVWSGSVFGRVAITGWIFHESQPIKRIFATTDLQAVQTLKYGRETPFLAGRPDTPAHATHAGYDGYLDLPAQLPLPVTVRVYAELDDGSWHLGSVARFTATDQEFAKQPFARFSPLSFWRAWRAIVRAIRARGWCVPTGADYRQVIRRAWREYSALAPRPKAMRPGPAGRPADPGKNACIHLVTHNLSHEGAPLFLLEYARQLQRETGARLAVTSGREGPLRHDFEALGAKVAVVDPDPLLNAKDTASVRRALQALGRAVDLRDAGLVVTNTLSSYWGVHLARQAGRPVLFYIHESTPPRIFFRSPRPVPALALVEEAFRLADRVSFLTATTQRYYAGLSDGSNYCLNPGWIDLADIDRFRAAHPRDELRPKLGLTPGRKLVINVGTVCERKGQHLFARAVDLLWRTAPDRAASAEFLMIGGRDTPYDRNLAEFIAGLSRPNLRIVPETGEVYPYYGAADLFVCSSYEESFPRVILEAMAFALPIVSTNVHGIPEIVRTGREAMLVPPGDSAALAAAIQGLLAAPETGRTLGDQSRARVAAEFDSRVVLPRHLALARSLAHGQT